MALIKVYGILVEALCLANPGVQNEAADLSFFGAFNMAEVQVTAHVYTFYSYHNDSVFNWKRL